MGFGDKKSLFGADGEELVQALEEIYKKQRATADEVASLKTILEEIKTHVIAMRTTVVDPAAGVAADPGDDGVPPMVKWALNQPWGVTLMHGLTDQDMISGLVKAGLEWVRGKAVAAVAKNQPPPTPPPAAAS